VLLVKKDDRSRAIVDLVFRSCVSFRLNNIPEKAKSKEQRVPCLQKKEKRKKIEEE